MSKLIVTHLSPDLDAIASSWLIKSFIPEWSEADHAFVPAGSTLNNDKVDNDSDIIHVDTGLGRFDHHHIEDRQLSATKRVFDYLINENLIKEKDREALTRIVDYVTVDDNFGDVYFHEPDSDVYDFCLHRVIDGLKITQSDDLQRMEIGFKLLDAELAVFKNKIKAENEIKKGYEFKSVWGKALALETKNDEVMKLAQKKGFPVVIRKDPEVGTVRIKTLPEKKYDLTPLYEKLKKADPAATWYLHVSKNMLLNGSVRNPNSVPSKLPLQKVIEIVKEIE